MGLVVAEDDPRTADVRGLLEQHLAFANEVTPRAGVHALDVDGLVDPAITFVSARLDGELVGVGALKDLGDGHAELKSMHTAAAARGRGVARAIVEHLLAVAVDWGAERVSLETGNLDAFAPARALYERLGFLPCAPFNEYVGSPTSTCMTRLLSRD